MGLPKHARQLTVRGALHTAHAGGCAAYAQCIWRAKLGGPAIDPGRQKLVVNTLHMGTVVQLIPRDQCEGEGPEPIADGPFLLEPSEGTPYCNRRWLGFVSPMGVPCTPPPWGTLAGIDLQTGNVDWQVPLGTTRDMAPWPFWYIKGSPNLGGPVSTAGGLPHFYRGDHGPLPARVRHRYRGRALERPAPHFRSRSTHHLSAH